MGGEFFMIRVLIVASAGKPVALIEPFHYATMNGQAVLEQVLYLLSSTQEGEAAT